MDEINSHFHIEHPPNMLPHLPYIPTWEELWAHENFGVRTSEANGMRITNVYPFNCIWLFFCFFFGVLYLFLFCFILNL